MLIVNKINKWISCKIVNAIFNRNPHNSEPYNRIGSTGVDWYLMGIYTTNKAFLAYLPVQ